VTELLTKESDRNFPHFKYVRDLPDGGVAQFEKEKEMFLNSAWKTFRAELPLLLGEVPQEEFEFARMCKFPQENNESGSYNFYDDFGVAKTEERYLQALREGMPVLISLWEEDAALFGTTLESLTIFRHMTPEGESPNPSNTVPHRDTILDPGWIVANKGGTEILQGVVTLGQGHSNVFSNEDRIDPSAHFITVPDRASARLSAGTVHKAPSRLPLGEKQRIFIKGYARSRLR